MSRSGRYRERARRASDAPAAGIAARTERRTVLEQERISQRLDLSSQRPPHPNLLSTHTVPVRL